MAAYPQQLSEVDVLRERLRNSENFGQEYVNRCTHLREVLHERSLEVERYEEELRLWRMGAQSLRAGSSGDPPPPESSGDPAPGNLRHRDIRNAYMQIERARHSIEAREPTVGPPPQLVVQYADDEAWIVQVPVPGHQSESSEDSELEGATTSSGEYTIKERSSDSSGGYQDDARLNERGRESLENRRPHSSGGSGATTGLAATILGQAVIPASGAVSHRESGQ